MPKPPQHRSTTAAAVSRFFPGRQFPAHAGHLWRGRGPCHCPPHPMCDTACAVLVRTTAIIASERMAAIIASERMACSAACAAPGLTRASASASRDLKLRHGQTAGGLRAAAARVAPCGRPRPQARTEALRGVSATVSQSDRARRRTDPGLSASAPLETQGHAEIHISGQQQVRIDLSQILRRH